MGRERGEERSAGDGEEDREEVEGGRGADVRGCVSLLSTEGKGESGGGGEEEEEEEDASATKSSRAVREEGNTSSAKSWRMVSITSHHA